VGRGYSDISHHEYNSISGLDHQPQERVDLVLPVAEVSALHKVVGLLPPAPGRVVELEGPQEVGGVLEVGADGEDLVDEVLHADDAHLAELGLDHLVGGDGGAVAVNLDKAALVDEVTHGLEVGAAVGDVGLCKLCPNVLLALTQRGCLAMWDQGRIFCSESMPRKKDFEVILEENINVCPILDLGGTNKDNFALNSNISVYNFSSPPIFGKIFTSECDANLIHLS